MPKTTTLTSQTSWLKPFAYAIGICLLITGLSRIGYVVWLDNRVAATNGIGFILVQGFRFDLVSLGYLLAIPAALTPLLNCSSTLSRAWAPALKWYLIAVIGAFLFMEVLTPPFISEYDIRPNYLFVEYLRYPKEVLSMLFVGYKLEVIVALIVIPAVMFPIYGVMQRQVSQMRRNRLLLATPFAFASLLICVMAARSTLDHRPANASTVAFSSDTLVNSLPLNSLYSAANAIYEMQHEDGGFPYGEISQSVAINAARQQMYIASGDFAYDGIPTLRNQVFTGNSARPQNLVIIIEESLGAEFVGSLGGLPLTPNIDKFSNEGIWFENLYATGTRSARGLEAIITGFPPTTSQSVLKLGKAQKNFFTIGEFLRRKGFDTSFIYGGEAQFDNMRRFFAGNGFDTVIDKHDFQNPTFEGSWGVADEDVFSYAHAYFESKPSNKPFASVLFTTTNHTPFEFPDDRIELYDTPKATVNNAVKYADHALGQYIQRAKESEYWRNTVFLIVSDHNSRVYGSELVPIERFHIPGVILGGTIEPQRWSRVASQIDLLPTLLSLIGVGGEHPAPGIDMTRQDIDMIPGRAVMQFGRTQAYRLEDQVVILRPEKAAELFDYSSGKLVAVDHPNTILKQAAAFAAWPSYAYRNGQYRLPPLAAKELTLVSTD